MIPSYGKWWGDETTGNDSIGSFYNYFGVAKPNVTVDTYTVKKGDTLSTIAKRFNTTAQELTLINSLANPNLIYGGQVIKLPNSTKKVNPYPVPSHNISRGAMGNDVKMATMGISQQGL